MAKRGLSLFLALLLALGTAAPAFAAGEEELSAPEDGELVVTSSTSCAWKSAKSGTTYKFRVRAVSGSTTSSFITDKTYKYTK